MARIIITNINENKEDAYILKPIDNNIFEYIDNEDAYCKVSIYNDGITIDRESKTHSTNIVLNYNSYVKINDKKREFIFSIKDIEINKNNDIISIVYSIDDVKNKITVEL